ncbi:Miro-like protein [Ancylostoma caninum]|uniref:Miro-like protein n=1 Tax=Ancylostoma caninum TaxID=29170 RepID=A0A368G2I1_ANCCA|nr:Miro-like protein [Ancylostoma caninum]
MRQPLRSQSFKHRPRPLIEVKKTAIEDVPSERRRSTPTISRRCSLVHRRVQEPRTDVWPEAKPANEFEEKFLRLPAAEEYKRVRQFKIDAKGAVVSRGDSFRRKKNEGTVKNDKSPSPYPISGSDSARESRSESVSSSEESRREAATATVDDPSTSHRAYKVYVVGDTGTGKSSLIGQLITSEYKNAFADEIRTSNIYALIMPYHKHTNSTEDYENTVSISLGGQELDLIFFESDMADTTWLTDEVDAFVVIYSIDSRRSWKQATMAIEMIRDSTTCRNSPIVVAGNKADLERKRTVTKNEVRTASAHFGFEPLEISVALDHDVDDLLVSLVAELKEAYAPDTSSIEKPSPRIEDDFHAAIRRYSQRKKKALPEDINTGWLSACGVCLQLGTSTIAYGQQLKLNATTTHTGRVKSPIPRHNAQIDK